MSDQDKLDFDPLKAGSLRLSRSKAAANDANETRVPGPQEEETIMRRDPLDAQAPSWVEPAAVREPQSSLDVSATDADAPDGNYIVTIGLPGSGKSTFQSHLLRFLFREGDYVAEPTADKAVDEDEWERTILRWRAYWQRGLFPDRTERGRFAEFRYTITPISPKGMPKLRFGMVEISGEELRNHEDRRLAPTPKLPMRIRQILASDTCSVIIVLVVNGADVTRDDDYLSMMIDLIRQDQQISHRSNCPIAILISDPTRAKQNMLDNRANELERYREGGGPISLEDVCTPENFCELMLRETTRTLHLWNAKPRTFFFNVGRTELHEGLLYVREASFEDANTIFRWMYQNFTGANPDGPWLYRLIKGFVS